MIIVKILILSQFFSSTRGGGEYVFTTIAKKLSENNHKVWVITNKIEHEQYTPNKNIQLIFVPPTLKYEGGLPPSFSDNLRYSLNTITKGVSIIKREKIDIIHSNNFSPALAGSILSLFTSKPHITSIWDIFTLCGKDYWQKWVKQKKVSKIHGILGKKFEKLILKVPCKAIHTISEATKDDLVEFGARKPIHVIFPTIENLECKQTHQNPLQFIYIGRLVFYKNLEVLIKAIKIVKNTEPQIKLIIVGGGPHEDDIKALIHNLELESNVELTGFVTAEEKLNLLSQSNALLFPSVCEGFGLVILEAFSQNKPVLVSDLRPMSDIVTHDKTGYLLDPNDEKMWAKFILKLIKDPQHSNLMGKNGNELLQTKYNSDLMYEQIIKMYNRVAN